MDYDELVSDIVRQVHVRYEDYVDYQKSEGLDVEPFDAMAEQMLDDELDGNLIYYNQMWTIIEHTCDDTGALSSVEPPLLMELHLTKHSGMTATTS